MSITDDPSGDFLKDTLDMSKWERDYFVQAAFNKMVIVRGNMWHSAEPKRGFGNDIYDCRLIQIMSFFTSEDKLQKRLLELT